MAERSETGDCAGSDSIFPLDKVLARLPSLDPECGQGGHQREEVSASLDIFVHCQPPRVVGRNISLRPVGTLEVFSALCRRNHHCKQTLQQHEQMVRSTFIHSPATHNLTESDKQTTTAGEACGPARVGSREESQLTQWACGLGALDFARLCQMQKSLNGVPPFGVSYISVYAAKQGKHCFW